MAKKRGDTMIRMVIRAVAMSWLLASTVGIVNQKNEVMTAYSWKNQDQCTEQLEVVSSAASKMKQEALATLLMNQFIANEMEGMRFSFEKKNYPERVEVTIYDSKKNFEERTKLFQFVGIRMEGDSLEYRITFE